MTFSSRIADLPGVKAAAPARRTAWARVAGACLLAVTLQAGAADLDDWWFYVKNDFWHQIEPLVQRGADPNRVSPDGQPTIVEAVRTKAWKTFDALASNPKVNVEAANKQGETALMLLSVLGETDRARKLLDRGAQVNRLGWTPLHYAASRARLDVAKLLISRKAIINAPAPDGTTPLMMAALSKNDAMVSLLVEAGADATTRNLSNLSAADWARSADATRIATRLDELAARQTQQRGAAGAGRAGAGNMGASGASAPAQAGDTNAIPTDATGRVGGNATGRAGAAGTEGSAGSAGSPRAAGASVPSRSDQAPAASSTDIDSARTVRGVSGVRLGTD